jgi:hypothetical protein
LGNGSLRATRTWQGALVIAAALATTIVCVPPVAGAVRIPSSHSPHAETSTPLITSVGPEGLGILVDWAPGSSAAESFQLTATPIVTSATPASCASPVTASASGSDTMSILDGVCAHVPYHVSLTERSSGGASVPSAPSEPVIPTVATPPLLPLLTSAVGGDREVLLRWEPPSYDGGKPISGFRVTLTARGFKRVLTLARSATSATARGLRNGVAYTVGLQAINAVGASHMSTSRATPTRPHAPSVPIGLSVVPSTPSVVTVSWSAPADDGGAQIDAYIVTSLEEVAHANGKAVVYSAAPGVRPVVRTTSSTSIEISGLRRSAVFYVFRVAARNAKGTSKPTHYSVPITLRTESSADVHVLTASMLSHATSYVDSTLTIRYASKSQVPKVVASLRTGDVVAAGVSVHTPFGLLRTVVSIAVTRPATYVVATAPASLSSAFRTLTADVALGNDSVGSRVAAAGRFTPQSPGMQVVAGPSGLVALPTLDLSIDKSVTLQGPSTPGHAQGSLTFDLQGDVQLAPSVDLEATVLTGWLGIPDGAQLSFASSITTTESSSFSVSGTAEQDWPVGRGTGVYPPECLSSQDLDSCFGPTDGDYCYGTFDVQLGPIPLILTPCVEINVKLSVTGQVSVTSSVTYQWGNEISWSSANPGVLTTTDLSTRPSATSPPISIAAQGQAEFGLDVKPELYLYGITGPYIDAFLGFVFTVAPTQQPWLKLDLQLSVAVGWQVQIQLLGINLQVQASGAWSWPIWASSGSPPPVLVPLVVTPVDPTVGPGASQQFDVEGASSPVTWSLEGQAAGDEITSSGLFTASQPSDRAVTVVATEQTGALGTATVAVGNGLGPPTGLNASIDDARTEATLTWTAPMPPPGISLASYAISTSPATHITTLAGSGASAVLTVIAGQDYVVTIVAIGSDGSESPPATIEVSTNKPTVLPVVNSISPTTGPSIGGTMVTITGSGFDPAPGATAVDFGPGNPASGVSCSTTTTCTAVSPRGSGTVGVIVLADGFGETPTLPQDGYTYLSGPGKSAQTITITSSAPSNPTVGGTYTPEATSSSGLAVAITVDSSSTTVCAISTGGVVTFNAEGTCTLDFNQGGNSAYDAAVEVTQSLSIGSGMYQVRFTQEQINGAYPITNCATNPWSVTLGGVTESCLASGNGPNNIYFEEPIGAYSFTVTPPTGFIFSPSTGTISVSGEPVVQQLAWSTTAQTWTEGVIPGQANGYEFDESLACSGSDCYERGIVQTSPSSYGIALWSSTNSGASWSSSPYVLPGVNLVQSCDGGGASGSSATMIGCLVSFGSTAFALGPQGATSSTDTSALWYTTDAGASWSERDMGSNVYGSYLACADTSDCYVLASYSGGFALFSTSNGGASWSDEVIPGEVGTVNPGGQSEMACPDVGTCIIANSSGVIETTNSGASWAQFGPSGVSTTVACPSSQICWLSAGTQIWSTTNLGSTWSQAGTLAYGPTQMGCQDQVSCMAVDENGDVYLTTDGGSVWSQQTLPNLEVPYCGYLTSAGGFLLGLDQDGAVGVWTDSSG